MTKHLVIALALAGVWAACAVAQKPIDVVPNQINEVAVAPVVPVEPGPCGPPGRFWLNAEYLLWWTNGQSYPALMTTGPVDNADPFASTSGLIGAPGTQVLFGGYQGDDFRSGARFSSGFWLNPDQTVGIQGRYYFLENANHSSTFSSDQYAVLTIPFFDTSIGAQQRFFVAFPGEFVGSTTFNTYSRFRGFDFEAVGNLYCDGVRRLDGVIGYRQMRLHEGLHIIDSESDLAGFKIDSQDTFDTRNTFHGVQLGLLYERRFERFYYQVNTRFGLGVNNRTVNINGSSIIFDPQAPGPVPANNGLFAQPSNFGRHDDSEFSFASEINIKLGYQFTPRLRGYVGYDFLYWTNVARPGNQMDTRIDTNQFLGQPGLNPAFEFKSSDFWAHGFDFGLEYRF